MNTKKHDIDRELIQELADILRSSGLAELEIESKGTRIRASLGTGAGPQMMMSAPAAMPAPAANQESAETTPAVANYETHPGALKSPMVGTAYLAPEPDAPAFVNVGDKVEAGQTLLIVEAMKVMNPIPAPKAGTVKEIIVQDSQALEFGDVLLIIE